MEFLHKAAANPLAFCTFIILTLTMFRVALEYETTAKMLLAALAIAATFLVVLAYGWSISTLFF
jgi:hypothetical protein